MKNKEVNKYAFGVYKPNKNCVPVTYKGVEYLSKAQCIALEKITRKELEEYLKNDELKDMNDEMPKDEVQEANDPIMDEDEGILDGIN